MILKLWHFIKGYLIIEVSGFSIERFMNLAVNKNIYLWGINYSNGKVTMKVSIKGYKQLKYCSKKTKCNIKIKNKVGLPFLAHTYRKRKVLLIGFFIFIFLLYFLSTFIWAIEITGNEQVKSYEILEFLEENNIGLGTRPNKRKTIILEDKILKNFDKLSWVNIQSKGTTLNINTSEILEEKFVNEEKLPSNIVSSKDALITYIAVSNGLASVKVNDVVKKGDTLITGEVFLNEDENGKHYRYTYSDGVVRGKLYYDMNFFVPVNYEAYEYTNKTKSRYSIIFGNKSINLFFNSDLYESYDIIVENNQLKFGENYRTPLVLKKQIFKEKKLIKSSRTIEECKEYALKVINEKIITEFDISVDVLEKNINYIEKDDGVEVNVEIVTIENIGIEEPIVFEKTETENIGD